jgi:hypothetical protein
MKFLCVILLFVSAKCFAQYPFEKYPVKKCDSIKFKVTDLETDSSNTSIATADYKDYKIKILEGHTLKDDSNILLYFKGKLIKKITAFHLGMMEEPFPLYIYQRNGKTDFLISYFNGDGTGLASARVCKLYLLNIHENLFKAVSFMDFYSNPGRQYGFDSSGNYEIVCQSLAEYKGHNYWLFDLYDFHDDRLVNVSKKHEYPIAVPYLFKETFKPTNKIPKKELYRLSAKLPEFYSSN